MDNNVLIVRSRNPTSSVIASSIAYLNFHSYCTFSMIVILIAPSTFRLLPYFPAVFLVLISPLDLLKRQYMIDIIHHVKLWSAFNGPPSIVRSLLLAAMLVLSTWPSFPLLWMPYRLRNITSVVSCSSMSFRRSCKYHRDSATNSVTCYIDLRRAFTNFLTSVTASFQLLSSDS
jgi:hypothetical protein